MPSTTTVIIIIIATSTTTFFFFFLFCFSFLFPVFPKRHIFPGFPRFSRYPQLSPASTSCVFSFSSTSSSVFLGCCCCSFFFLFLHFLFSVLFGIHYLSTGSPEHWNTRIRTVSRHMAARETGKLQEAHRKVAHETLSSYKM